MTEGFASGAGFDLEGDIVELVACPAPPSERLPELAFRANAWLPDEVEVLRTLFAADIEWETIAAALQRGVAGVRDKAVQLGLRRNSNRPWSEMEDAEVVRRYGAEAPATIAQDLGRAVTAVYARARLLGVSEPNPPPYTAWEDAQIVAGYAAAVPVSQIAALIGRPLSGMRARASRLGLRHRHQPADWSDEEATRALELAESGLAYRTLTARLASEGFPRREHLAVGQRLRILGYGRGWGRRWTADEDELIARAYAAGDSLTPLQSRLGRSLYSLHWRAGELGLRGTHARPDGWRGRAWTAEEEARLREGYGKVAPAQLERELDRKWPAIRQRAAHLGIKHGWMRAFEPDEDRAIAIAWREGISIVDLSLALGRDPSVIGRRCKRDLGFTFSDRPIAAPLTARARRAALTLADILALPTRVPAEASLVARERPGRCDSSHPLHSPDRNPPPATGADG
jgi:hypothetical protein